MWPNRLVKVATSRQGFSVAVECIVENEKNKKHKNRVLPPEWDSEKRRNAEGEDVKMMRRP